MEGVNQVFINFEWCLDHVMNCRHDEAAEKLGREERCEICEEINYILKKYRVELPEKSSVMARNIAEATKNISG